MTRASIHKTQFERFKRGSLDNEPYLCEPKDNPDYVNVWIITPEELKEILDKQGYLLAEYTLQVLHLEDKIDELGKINRWNDKLIQDLKARISQLELQNQNK